MYFIFIFGLLPCFWTSTCLVAGEPALERAMTLNLLTLKVKPFLNQGNSNTTRVSQMHCFTNITSKHTPVR